MFLFHGVYPCTSPEPFTEEWVGDLPSNVLQQSISDGGHKPCSLSGHSFMILIAGCQALSTMQIRKQGLMQKFQAWVFDWNLHPNTWTLVLLLAIFILLDP